MSSGCGAAAAKAITEPYRNRTRLMRQRSQLEIDATPAVRIRDAVTQCVNGSAGTK